MSEARLRLIGKLRHGLEGTLFKCSVCADIVHAISSAAIHHRDTITQCISKRCVHVSVLEADLSRLRSRASSRTKTSPRSTPSVHGTTSWVHSPFIPVYSTVTDICVVGRNGSGKSNFFSGRLSLCDL